MYTLVKLLVRLYVTQMRNVCTITHISIRIIVSIPKYKYSYNYSYHVISMNVKLPKELWVYISIKLSINVCNHSI